MSEYQLGLIAPQRIEALRVEADNFRRMRPARQPRRAQSTASAKVFAAVRLLARRIVPAT